MKKKILSFVIAICLILPCALTLSACKHEHEFDTNYTINDTHHWYKCKTCTEIKDKEAHDWDNGVITVPATKTSKGVKLFTCKDCGKTKTEDVDYVPVTTIAQTEWTQALSLNTVSNIKLVQSIGNDLYTIIRDGDVIKRITTIGSDITTSDYYSKETDKYYNYSFSGTTWTKVEIEESDYNMVLAGIDLSGTDYNAFTYSSETKSYNGTIGTLTNAKLYFEDGKLVKLTATIEEKDVVYNFEYENIEDITLPTVA